MPITSKMGLLGKIRSPGCDLTLVPLMLLLSLDFGPSLYFLHYCHKVFSIRVQVLLIKLWKSVNYVSLLSLTGLNA